MVRAWLTAVGVGMCAACLAGGEDRGAGVEFGGGITLVGQRTSDPQIGASLTASLDLFLAVPSRRGALEIYVEANTTPPRGGVAGALPETNGDAGTALDDESSGRLQVSEIKYDFALPGERRLAVGLIDLTAYLDTSRIDNDENLQFLATPLINNPAIEFPDYAPGLAFRQPQRGARPEIHAALASSSGLADNPGRSYSEVFDVRAPGKGVFAAVETGWGLRGSRVRVGAWFNGRAHDSLAGNATDRSNAGLWTAAARTAGRHTFGLRLGAADSTVSPGDRFASFAYRLDGGGRVLGVALAGLHASDDLAGAEDTALFEIYCSLRLAPSLFLTPSFQQVWNSGFDPAPRADRITVAALRLHYAF